MSYDPIQQPTFARADGRVVDAGLQAHMRSVYNTMCWGLAVTAAVAWSVANVAPLRSLVFGTPLSWVFALAPLFFVMFGFSANRVRRLTAQQVRNTFIGFSALMGVSMGTIFMYYSGVSIARVFVITAGTFAAMSLIGYTTKRDLSAMGSFMMMGMIGIVLASVVNIFVASAAINFVVSILGVVIFTGLTAWETQMIKENYAEANGVESNSKMATMGALNLYMSFINLFQFLMSFMGNNRN
ncbi:MAG: Bax inhibitor-1/YccA family protein [Micavibrio sp.]|nr:Bax inhibitor-1/YccA family protein [Micavibrio sp.]